MVCLDTGKLSKIYAVAQLTKSHSSPSPNNITELRTSYQTSAFVIPACFSSSKAEGKRRAPSRQLIWKGFFRRRFLSSSILLIFFKGIWWEMGGPFGVVFVKTDIGVYYTINFFMSLLLSFLLVSLF